jgi:outer membrane protein insertion porin family
MKRMAGMIGAAVLVWTVATTLAQSPQKIADIEIVGANTVSRMQVMAWSGLAAGQAFTPEAVATGIRRLFATQKFADIYVYQAETDAGLKLIINLREFPRVRKIEFEGNKKIKDAELQEALPVQTGQFANPAVISRNLEAIRELYYEKGFYNVRVHTDSSRIDQSNLEDLVVSVEEGKKVKVKSIRFTGNRVLKEDDLRGAMKQKTGGFLRSGTFKKQQFESDKELIVAYCRDKGFLDAEIENVELNFQENREKLDIVIQMQEGERYTVGDIRWRGNTVFDDLAIADMIDMEKGQIFSEGDYILTLQELHSLYADQGYIYITVEPVREIREHSVNVTFVFREGEPAKIHDIRVEDNLKTFDNVVLRELQIFPGDVFSNAKVMRSQRDIMQLGYFDEVRPDFEPVGEEGDIDLIFKVKERQTGQFMFGMAYSVQTRATGFIQVAENNFRGRGQNIGLTWQFGKRRRYIDLSFTEPWFRGTQTLVGVDVFDRFQYNFDDYYESRVRGFSLRLGRRIPGTRFSRVGLRYELSNTRLSNFSSSYIRFLDDLEEQLGTRDLPFERLDQVDWPRSKSALRLSLSRNSTDNPFFPTSGSNTSYSVELSGGPLGADIDYHKHLFTHSFYEKLPGGFALHLRAFSGLIAGLESGDNVPDYEKFRLGGNRLYPLRGYQDLEVVPRGNPAFIGGRFFTIFNAEILYPLTSAVQLLAFLDQGDTWNSFGEADFTNLRKGAGFGVRVEVPMMGTIGFDYGYGFDRAGGPSWEPHFNIGSFF